MASTNDKKTARLKRKSRIRKKIKGTEERPRLSVFRSSKHIYAQVINDIDGKTLFSSSSKNIELKEEPAEAKAEADDKKKKKKKELSGKVKIAHFVGRKIGEQAVSSGIKKVVFDRNGYLYHGRVKALSEGARKSGLEF